MDLHRVCNHSGWVAFHFRDDQSRFCLQETLSISPSGIFLFPGSFHPTRWSPAFPRRPDSKRLPLHSYPVNLTLIWRADVLPPLRALFPALLSLSFKETHEYMDFVSWIDAPLLNLMDIFFFSQSVLVIPHLSQFISCSTKLGIECALFPWLRSGHTPLANAVIWWWVSSG